MQSIVVVNKLKDWDFQIPDVDVISAKSYLTDSQYAEITNARIYNLCQPYRYQGLGYYVSLLAEARGHRSFPNITTIQDLKTQSIIRIFSDELDDLIQRSLTRISKPKFELNIYFGSSVASHHDQLSKQLYNLFQAPLLKICFTHDDEKNKWLLQNIFPLPLNQIPEEDKVFLLQCANQYFCKKRIRSPGRNNNTTYDIAILVNPEEKIPPSNKKAINLFLDAADDLNMRAKLITRHDYNRIAEFDGLFIRETTSVNHHTYRFARRGVAENLIVVDDPISIVRCTNKVYMTEMMKKANISTPRTVIMHKGNKDELINAFPAPYILKQPDGSFSSGVLKVNDEKDLDDVLQHLLNQSDLIIAQEFVPTSFDWRIGILNKVPLYACKYYMAKNHWQINQWHEGTLKEGGDEAVPLDRVPLKVLKVAQRAAALIGDGFYGVDLKETNNNVLVIEVNDNPSIDHQVEDAILKESLYKEVMQYFLNKINQKKESSMRKQIPTIIASFFILMTTSVVATLSTSHPVYAETVQAMSPGDMATTPTVASPNTVNDSASAPTAAATTPTTTASSTVASGPVLSPSDAAIMKQIDLRLRLPKPGPINITVLNNDVTITGIASSNNQVTDIIANVVAIPAVRNINFNALTLGNGNYPNPIAVAVGFTQGRMIRTNLFGNSVQMVGDLPVKVTAENDIIYLDGGVVNLYTQTHSIIIAQRAVLEYARYGRVISRLWIKPMTVNTP